MGYTGSAQVCLAGACPLDYRIRVLEAEQHALTARMCAPGYHQQAAETLKADRDN